MTDTFDVLRRVVAEAKYKPGWTFRIVEEDGALRLVITDYDCIDAYEPHRPMPLSQSFAYAVPCGASAPRLFIGENGNG